MTTVMPRGSIGKLSTNPLVFRGVSLNYTRTEILRDYGVRRFEIQMQMDLDPLLSAEDPDPPAVAAKSFHTEGVPGQCPLMPVQRTFTAVFDCRRLRGLDGGVCTAGGGSVCSGDVAGGR